MVAHEIMPIRDSELLRFITCGSVDDGKSTLIGRLLHDAKSIFEDQLQAIASSTRRKGLGGVNLSLLTDGLQAEREQGITIDVAYRYFATPRRKFIIADTPGHEQYTRNMVTGASTANLAIILIDARKGLLTQSRRHAYLASLVGIPHLVVAVNKMDLVGYSEQVFDTICKEFAEFAAGLNLDNIVYLPISALHGDNVVERSMQMPWFSGEPLLSVLEQIRIDHDLNLRDFRFPVQLVSRPGGNEWHDFRGYMGRIESGVIRVGDAIVVLPSGHTTRIKEIWRDGHKTELAIAPQSVTLTVEDSLDISRGDMLVHRIDGYQDTQAIERHPRVTREFEAMLCWMDERPLDRQRKYYIKQAVKTVKGSLTDLEFRVDINTLQRDAQAKTLAMNDIGRAQIRVQQTLVLDSYGDNRATGSFIVIDEATNNTVAAGMIV